MPDRDAGLTRIVVIVPNRLYREALVLSLAAAQFEIVAAVPDFDQLSQSLSGDAGCDLILIQSEDVGALKQLCGGIRARFANAKIVMLANPEIDSAGTARALKTGVDSIVLPHGSTDSFVQSLRLAHMGEATIPMRLAVQLLGEGHESGTDAPASPNGVGNYNLSNREMQILRLLVAGRSNKEIAKELAITEATVKVHVKSVLRKVQVANRTQAAIWALHHGMGEPAN